MEDLKKIVNSVKIPAFAIGGININNVMDVKKYRFARGMFSVRDIIRNRL